MNLRIQYEGGRSSDSVTISFTSNDHPDNNGGGGVIGTDLQRGDDGGKFITAIYLLNYANPTKNYAYHIRSVKGKLLLKHYVYLFLILFAVKE